MRLKITEVNFLSEPNWLFKLVDGKKKEYYVMNSAFYEVHGLKSPVTRKEMDGFDKGHWINAHAEHIEDMNVIIRLY